MLVDRAAADQALADIERHRTPFIEPADDPLHLAHHFRADAVAGEDQQFLVLGHVLSVFGKVFCRGDLGSPSFRAAALKGLRSYDHSQGWPLRFLASKPSIDAAFSRVRPISSRPFSRQCLRKASSSNLMQPPSGPRIS